MISEEKIEEEQSINNRKIFLSHQFLNKIIKMA